MVLALRSSRPSCEGRVDVFEKGEKDPAYLNIYKQSPIVCEAFCKPPRLACPRNGERERSLSDSLQACESSVVSTERQVRAAGALKGCIYADETVASTRSGKVS
jgi:hypothetical protein